METDKQIDLQNQYYEKFGINKEVRNERLQILIDDLKSILEENGYKITASVEEIDSRTVVVQGRVKSFERYKEKINRLDYDFSDVFDGWGLEVIIDGADDESVLEDLIKDSYKKTPVPDDLTRSDGSQQSMATISGPQTSIASHPDFRAVTIFKKSEFGIVSIRLVQKDIHKRTQDPNDPLHHDNYRNRQSIMI
jgi:hypothetical protein